MENKLNELTLRVTFIEDRVIIYAVEGTAAICLYNGKNDDEATAQILAISKMM